MKKLLLPIGLLFSSSLFAQTAKLQIIHNCATPVADTVDVYAGSTKLVDNLAFRNNTEYLTVPAGVDIRVGIALKNSASVNDTLSGLGQTIKLADGMEYVAIASGLVGNTSTPFKLIAFAGKSTAPVASPALTPIAIHHGSPDAPRVDIVARGVRTLATASYGETAPYQSVPSASYTLDVKAAGTNTTVISYTADLRIAPNVPVVAFASGLLTPGAGPAFGIFVSTPNKGAAIALPTAALPTPMAKLQVIHNCPTPVADTVDVYAGSLKLIDNLAFRNGTKYEEVPAGVDIRIGIALKGSTSVNDTLAGLGQTIKLEEGKEYVAIASGLVGSTATPFRLIAFEGKSSVAATTPASTSLAIHHGSPDAPRVDIVARGVGTLATASFGETAPYQSVLSSSYILDVNAAGTTTTVISFDADLSIAPNTPVVAFASGLLTPGTGEPGFGIFVITPAGGRAIALPVNTTTGLFGDALAEEQTALYPNPANNFVRLKNQGLTELTIMNNQGMVVRNYAGNIPSEIDLSSLENGLYTFRMNRNGNMSIKKLSVVR